MSTRYSLNYSHIELRDDGEPDMMATVEVPLIIERNERATTVARKKWAEIKKQATLDPQADRYIRNDPRFLTITVPPL